MAMFQNWSTKDDIETSIRTFQRVRDEIENTFSKIEWKDDENGRETYNNNNNNNNNNNSNDDNDDDDDDDICNLTWWWWWWWYL